MEIKLDGPYYSVGDGDTLNIEENAVFYLACCDCGLTHKIHALTNSKLVISVDKRKTAACKRRMKERGK